MLYELNGLNITIKYYILYTHIQIHKIPYQHAHIHIHIHIYINIHIYITIHLYVYTTIVIIINYVYSIFYILCYILYSVCCILHAQSLFNTYEAHGGTAGNGDGALLLLEELKEGGGILWEWGGDLLVLYVLIINIKK